MQHGRERASRRTTSLLRVIVSASVGAITFAPGTLLGGVARVSASPGDVPFMIDFEDAPSGRSGTGVPEFTDFYERVGVVFQQPVTAVIFDENSIPALDGLARSGSTVVTDCYAKEFCSNLMSFSVPPAARELRIWVGYSQPLPEPATVIFEGFDRSDDTVSLATDVLGPSDAAIPVRVPLTLDDPDGRIVRAEVRWADSALFLGGLVVDDLEFLPIRTPIETQPTVPPTEPTASPTEPTASPTEPTASPTEPTASPTEQTDGPDDADQPARSTDPGADDEDVSSAIAWWVWLIAAAAVGAVAIAVASAVRSYRRRARPRPDRWKITGREGPGSSTMDRLDEPVIVIRGSLHPDSGWTEITDQPDDSDQHDRHNGEGDTT